MLAKVKRDSVFDNGGQMHKIRMPLPIADHDPRMTESLAAIGKALRNRLD